MSPILEFTIVRLTIDSIIDNAATAAPSAIAAAKSVAAQNGYASGVSVNTLANANQLKVSIDKWVPAVRAAGVKPE